MQIVVFEDSKTVAEHAAALIARNARQAFQERRKFVIAVSGGRTPWIMLGNLANQEVPWGGVHIFQVDERIAPEGEADRNLTHLREALLRAAPIDPITIHAMVVDCPDLEGAAELYGRTLRAITGQPPVIDLVHLGLGPDGHTASLVPGDPVLNVHDKDVAVTQPYQGRRRMTLTYPVLNRARQVLWVVTGGEKAKALHQLLDRDSSFPGGLVAQERALVFADEAAAGELKNLGARRARCGS